MDHSHLHARARTKGVNPIVYWLMRAWLQPFAHIYWRLIRIGREHVPQDGPVIFVCNHRSFIDPFIIGLCSRRPVYYVAKEELFTNRLLGWFISSSLARSRSAAARPTRDMIETAKAILKRGDPVLIFPEGTRTRPGALGKPKRGVGRLALETGATVVPVAMIGTEAIRKGFRVRPHKIRVRIGAPLNFPQVESATGQLAAAVTDRIWPNVMLQWEWLGGLPPLRRAAVIGGGSWGTAVAVMLARSGVEVELGCRTKAQADLMAATRENPRYLPGVELPAKVHPVKASELELGRHDLVAFAVPAAELPQVIAAHAPKLAPRTGVLVLSKGLVPPLGTLPSSYVAERTHAWAVGVLGGPAHAADALDDGASLVLATKDPSFSRQVSDALRAAGLRVTKTTDVVGVELAGCAKNAAALAAAAAGGRRPERRRRRRRAWSSPRSTRSPAPTAPSRRRSPAWPAPATSSPPCSPRARATAARASCSRRACRRRRSARRSGRPPRPSPRSRCSTPRLQQAGVDAPVLKGLAGIIEGKVEPERWRASLTAPKPSKKAQSAKAA